MFKNNAHPRINLNENQLYVGENMNILKYLSRDHQNHQSVDVLYIDAPYNTGHERFIGSEDNKSSIENRQAWLTMIRDRLVEALILLKKTGFVLFSIDDHQLAHVKILLDELLGESNFVSNFVWQRRENIIFDEKEVAQQHEYVLCYKVSDQSTLNGKISSYILNDTDMKQGGGFHYLHASFQDKAQQTVNDLIGGNFVTNYPKPVNLLAELFECLLPNTGGAVLDIFAGSGTTGHAVLLLNQQLDQKHKFILVQLPKDKPDKMYKNVASLTRSRIEAVKKQYHDDSKFQIYTYKSI